MENNSKLFGTDGIRGRANRYPMTADMALKVGQAFGYILNQQSTHRVSTGNPCKVLIGKDTRLSGYMIEQALASGLNSMGVHVQLVGPLPTPGIGFLAQNMRVDAGIVISASHNPFSDNGIKIFGSDGFKISDQVENEIEQLIHSGTLDSQLASVEQIGRTRRIDDSAGRYIVNVKNTFPLAYSLEGIRIVLDCANGAAYKVAPQIFQELGAEVINLGNQPNGKNINDKVGALYPELTREAVLKYRADIGICLDGDADRVVLLDEKGELVNGDHILGICALHMKASGRLLKDTLVVTHMSNFGLHKKMKENGIHVVKTNVGDKNVVEEMRRNGFSLGGEQSGHIIFMQHSTTGDGCVAALNVLATMREQNKALSELSAGIEDVPQVLVNVTVARRVDLATLPGYAKMIEAIEERLGSEGGRVFVRFSGTEPLVRILIEGSDASFIQQSAQQVADYLKKHLQA